MQLRGSHDQPFSLPFEVDENSFLQWDSNLADTGGYEYDALDRKLIIKAKAGHIHEGTVEEFWDLFRSLGNSDVLKEKVDLSLRTNQSEHRDHPASSKH